LRYLIIALLVSVLLLTACGAVEDNAETTAPRGTTQAVETTETTRPVETTGPTVTTQTGDDGEPGSQDKIDFAIDDLVKRTGIDPGEVVVDSAQEVTWRDGSLGCPLPGMNYTQALVDGMRIVLEANGTVYHYHSGGDKDPFYCENPAEPSGGGSSDS
jgi:hypothetical protein